ncbi:hypothetical protein GCM10027422_17110 [Hymenobacter arcticus]
MKKALLTLLLVFIISLGWLSRGAALDPALLSKAKQEHWRNRSKLRNARYLTIIDYRRSILQDRLYVYDLQKQETVIQSRVSHAFWSGILYPTSFSNVEGSEQSCYGSFLSAEAYHGKFGYSMRIDGISPTNTLARSRSVVFHPGRTFSAACYMTEPEINERLINLIKGKSLIVVYK